MRVAVVLLAALAAGATSLTAQVRPALPTGARTVPEPHRTRYFPLSDGIMGEAMAASIPATQGIHWREMMGGAAYAMRHEPDGGPRCDPDQANPRIEFFVLHTGEGSRLAVNPGAQIGVLYLEGTVTRYVQRADFCESGRFAKGGEQPGYLYLPFAAQGWSPRNFTATTLMPEGQPAASIGGVGLTATVTGIMSGPNLNVRLGGYASSSLLGQSQALSEEPGGQAGAAMVQQMLGQGAAADALRGMPGMVPGADGEGWLQLTLADQPMEAIAGTNAPFVFVNVRVVHAGTEVPAGPAYEALQQLLRGEREVIYDPAFVNDPRRRPQ